MERRDPEGDPRGLVGVGPENRRDKTAAALGDERNRTVEVLIAEEGRHRAERLDDVSGRRGRIVGAQQCRRHERASFGVESGEFRCEHRAGPQAGDGGVDVGSLLQTDEGPHVGGVVGGMADRNRLQSGDEGVADGVEVGVGHDHSADGGAFLAGLGDHFADDGVAERSELRRVGPGRWRKDGGVE